VILLDTSVVSAALRRRRRGEQEEETARRVAALLEGEEQIALPGVVLQEVLSGVVDRAQYQRLLDGIRNSFPVALATEGDHLKAADLTAAAAREGIALSTPDALIAAQALNHRARLFTTDGDFLRLASVTSLRLF
jgi:predicted nucleic acid-binding protein